MKIGIDIGGSHIGIGIVNDGGLIGEKYEYELKEKDKLNIENCIKNIIVNVIKNWEKVYNTKVEKIGIGIPGIVQNNIIKRCVNLGINNFDLYNDLQVFFPYADIKIKNDAKCAALAEKKLGALKNFEESIFLCIGTGIGGAVFYQNELIKPIRSSGFEFGHTVIVKNGRICRCGSKGCLECYASMRAFKTGIRNVFNLDNNVDGEELLNIVKNNIHNECVKIVIKEYIEELCIGISNAVDIFEPQAICLGGGFSYYKDILLSKLEDEFYNSNYVFYKEHMPKIVIAELGNDAGIIGSALYN